MPLPGFHPAVATWFERTFGEPTPPQVEGWPAIREGKHTLIASPTGSGKTLAAFLCAIDDLVQRGLSEGLADRVSVLYISPLKALSNDIDKNLQAPLEGIRGTLEELGHGDVDIRTAVRTGDTPSHVRTKMVKKPPHIFVTTPESLYILLTSEGGRRMLSDVRTVIVDEIHAVVTNKRGCPPRAVARAARGVGRPRHHPDRALRNAKSDRRRGPLPGWRPRGERRRRTPLRTAGSSMSGISARWTLPSSSLVLLSKP